MTDQLLLFLISIGIGVAITAPPGPVAALCIARTLREGLLSGLLSGFGVALGDAVLAWIAALGLSAVDPNWPGHRWLALAAAPVLVWLSVIFIRRARAGSAVAGTTDPEQPVAPGVGKTAGNIGSTLVLAFTTPGTLPGFVALYTALGLGSRIPPGWAGPAVMSSGVLIGAMLWWLGVCVLIAKLRSRVTGRIHVVDYVSGVLMLMAAGYALYIAVG